MLPWELRRLSFPTPARMLPVEQSPEQPESELSPRQNGLAELESSPFGSGTSSPMDNRSSSSVFEAGIASSSISSERESGSCASIPREDGMCFFSSTCCTKALFRCLHCRKPVCGYFPCFGRHCTKCHRDRMCKSCAQVCCDSGNHISRSPSSAYIGFLSRAPLMRHCS